MEEKNVNLKIIPPREYLPRYVAAAVVVLILFLVAMTASGLVEISNKIKESRYIGQGTLNKNIISISGEGKVLAKPDIGQVDLTVLSTAAAVTAAVNDNTSKINKVTQAMKDLGVAEEDLKTANYSISPQYQYISGKSIIIGYQVSQTLLVKIRDLDKVGAILEKATSLGANQVGSLTFTFDDPEQLNDEARQKAIADAKRKAEDLAFSLGVTLGRVVSFGESGGAIPPTPLYYSMAEGRGGGGDATPTIQTGQNEVQVNVSVTYEIY